jgi:hypothetical protein
MLMVESGVSKWAAIAGTAAAGWPEPGGDPQELLDGHLRSGGRNTGFSLDFSVREVRELRWYSEDL